jgi:hypothetical protein
VEAAEGFVPLFSESVLSAFNPNEPAPPLAKPGLRDFSRHCDTLSVSHRKG